MTKKGKKVFTGNITCFFFLPLSHFDHFFSFCASAALLFIGTFGLKPPTKGESCMRTLGDLSPPTPPSGHKRNLACSESLVARTRGCHDRPQLLVMALLGCSITPLLYRCEEEEEWRSPSALHQRNMTVFDLWFQMTACEAAKGPKPTASIDQHFLLL